MPKVFVAPGHGRKPGGTFDPGAVGQAGGRKFVEHDFNTKVANAGGSGSEVVINDSTSAANRKLAGKMADALGIRNRGVLPAGPEHGRRRHRHRHRGCQDEEGLTMADANEIMAFLQDLKQDMVVQGTPSLEVTVEKFAEHQREALAKLRDIDQRLTRIEQHLGQ